MAHHAQTNLLTLVASKRKADRFHVTPLRPSCFGPEFEDELKAEREARKKAQAEARRQGEAA